MALALSKELVTVGSRLNPRRDKCDSKMVEKRGGNKPKCGETERDTGRSMEALVARLPRMLSDSGRLMTGSSGHSESERAGVNPKNRDTPSH